MKLFKVIAFNCFTVLMLFSSCRAQEKEVVNDPAEYEYFADWAIDTEYMEAGCNGGYDCIRSLDTPRFVGVEEVDFLQPEDLVIGIRMGNDVHCYPHVILDWHEIVNDKIDDIAFSINYCPLTGSGMAWDRRVNGQLTQFGVSGLLYNSNVIPYDRATGSHWSQMRQQCVNGAYYKAKVTAYPVIETTWATWKALYPNSQVVSTETGFRRDYGNYPYYSYKENQDVFFPTAHDADSIHPKKRFYGVLEDDQVALFDYNRFAFGPGVAADTAFEKKVWVAGSAPDNYMVVFKAPKDKPDFSLQSVSGKGPALLQDNEGYTYDLFGYVIDGPDEGIPLERMNGYTAYWFAWVAFFPELHL